MFDGKRCFFFVFHSCWCCFVIWSRKPCVKMRPADDKSVRLQLTCSETNHGIQSILVMTKRLNETNDKKLKSKAQSSDYELRANNIAKGNNARWCCAVVLYASNCFSGGSTPFWSKSALQSCVTRNVALWSVLCVCFFLGGRTASTLFQQLDKNSCTRWK